MVGESVRPCPAMRRSSSSSWAKPEAGAAHGEGGADDDGVTAERLDAGDDVVHGVADDRAGGLAVTDLRLDGLDDALEEVAVLALVDGLDVGADELDAVLLQDTVLVHGDRGVERGLAAQRGEQRVGALLGDDLLDELGVIGSTYVASAISGSVMIVAGLEFTRMTRRPSALSTRQAWVPE